jgi:hypothetical protein
MPWESQTESFCEAMPAQGRQHCCNGLLYSMRSALKVLCLSLFLSGSTLVKNFQNRVTL